MPLPRRAPLTWLVVLAAGLAVVTASQPPAAAAPVAAAEVRELAVPAVALRAGTRVAAAGERRAGTLLAQLPARRTDPFSTVGVTWAPGGAAPQTEVRVRRGEMWSGWTLLEHAVADGPDGPEASRARPGTAPLWVGDADGIEVRLVSDGSTSRPVPDDIKVALIDPRALPGDASLPAERPRAAAPAAPGLAPRPAIVSRARWGADESLRSYNGSGCATPDYDATIRAGIVHHTAGSNRYSAAQSAALVRGIYAFHVKSRGWCDIGYNFLVDRYGTVFEGRYGGVWRVVHGAHATSWNTDTVGVSMMGNFETARPTAAVRSSVARLLAWKLDGFYRNPTGRVRLAGKTIEVISGHGDVMSTACPGRMMFARMDALRADVDARVGSYATPIYTRWRSLGGESGWVGSPNAPERVLLDGRITRFAGADLLWSPTTGARWIRGAQRTRYRSLGDARHYLGFPTSDERAGILGSRVTRFQRGVIYDGPRTNPVELYGSFYARHTRLSARAQTYLGLPTRAQRAGRITGSQYQPFQYGGLYWSPASGSHEVYRTFFDYYQRLGAAATRLGLPLASQQRGAVPGLILQRFQRGTLYWSRAVGTQEVNGAIFATYARLGAEQSRLRLPTRGDYPVSGGRATDFQGGRIVFNATTGQTRVTYF